MLAIVFPTAINVDFYGCLSNMIAANLMYRQATAPQGYLRLEGLILEPSVLHNDGMGKSQPTVKGDSPL